MFYNKVTPLSAQRHKDWHFNRTNNYSFTKSTNSVPLMAIEFLNASGEYPIVFVGDDEVLPVALLGMQNSENIYLSSEGKWEGKYVPAFIRRYPFVLSEAEDQKNAYLCIDESYPGFNQKQEGFPLICEDGKPSETTEEVLKFLGQFQSEYERTKLICKKLKELNLLEPKQVEVKLPSDQTKKVKGFYAIERSRVMTLPSEAILELVQSNIYEIICHHLASLRNFNKLGNPKNL